MTLGMERQHRLPLTCIIGAGPSGLTAAKALQDRGIPFDCFERSDRVGGLWAFDNPRGTPTAYGSLRPNTSKARTQFEDLPMPAEYPDFPTHLQIAAYLEDYADRFGLRDRITFDSAVERAEMQGDGTWKVTPEGEETRSYDALIVANGHHWDPLWPDPPVPGHFDGVQLHARDYLGPDGLEDKTVVVVGFGNSAVDIAVDVSRVAARTMLSVRRGAHILPSRLLGRPLDQIETIVPRPLRRALGGRLTGLALRAGYRMGRIPEPRAYGLPPPDQPLSAEHPTVSDQLFERLEAGAIVARPSLSELAGREVRFEDGASETVDVIVFCTGYRVSFPFLDPRLISAPDNRLPLFHRVFKPDLPSVFFIGLAQPIGPTIRLVEAQSKWVAAHLAGIYALPGREEMERAIAAEEERRRRRFGASPRFTMQVEFWPYLREIKRELRRGRRRAESARFEPPPAGLAARGVVDEAANDDGAAPALSVILATDELETIEETLSHLRAQTASEQLELIVAAPAGVADAESAELAGFHSVRTVEHDPFASLAAARAAGVGAASAPLIAFAETHCFPEPEWAEALIEAHRGPWAAVGPEMDNENPTSSISWANLLIGYGPWVAPTPSGPTDHLPGRNSCYKRSILLDYQGELADLLDAESIIHWDLRARGHRLYLHPAARVCHRNTTGLGPASREIFQSGRAFASIRAREWRLRRRAYYAAGTPLLPLRRLARIVAGRWRKRRARVALRALPAMAWLLVASAAGELVGYLAGDNDSMRRQLAVSELRNER